AAHTQRERHIAGNAHVRPQRIGLEHHADPPLLGRQGPTPATHDVFRKPHGAEIGNLETGDEPQQRGLAATRRPEHREELAVRDREAHILDRARRAEALGDLVEAYARHGTTPSGRLRPRRPARAASASVTATEMVPTAAAAGELPSYCRKNT